MVVRFVSTAGITRVCSRNIKVNRPHHFPIRRLASITPQFDMENSTKFQQPRTALMPYTHCNTRIVSLLELDLPANATEDEYKDIYKRISQSKTPEARDLTDAISSVSFGIAPPVAFPTETVYGLGADATNRASIAGIFAAKGRPSDNPLIVHVASREHVERLTGEPLPEIYRDLLDEYWPGPLTVLVPVAEQSVFAPNVHPGQKTIGFRVPASKYARFFVAATDRPIAAPSANSSGKPSPTIAQHVMHDLRGKINFVLDGGSCDVGVESTVVDGLHDPPLILRPGGVSQEELIDHGKRHGTAWSRTAVGYRQALPSATTPGTGEVSEAPRAPGMKYKHYAPHGRMLLFDIANAEGQLYSELNHILDQMLTTTPSQLRQAIDSTHEPNQSALKIAILTTSTWAPFASLPLDDPEPTVNGHGSGHGFTAPETDGAGNKNDTLSVERRKFRGHTIFSLPLGKSTRSAAQNLFAALRTCDDLGCHYILAEAPQKPKSRSASSSETTNGHDDLAAREAVAEPSAKKARLNSISMEMDYRYDAVIERMRKAASQVIE